MKVDQRYGMWAVVEADTGVPRAMFDTRVDALGFEKTVDYKAEIVPVQIVIETSRDDIVIRRKQVG